MKTWPVPNSPSRTIPEPVTAGCFWEDRGDRHHCGVDIYAPKGSDVVCVAPGDVIETGIFTSPDKVPYWYVTYYAIIKNDDGAYCTYAEMKDVQVEEGQRIEAGSLLGHVGNVLDRDKINGNSPGYIQRLKEAENDSMLHFEVFSERPTGTDDYLGGNWFNEGRPPGLMDAGRYLLED